MKWTSWPRFASSSPSAEASTPLPPHRRITRDADLQWACGRHVRSGRRRRPGEPREANTGGSLGKSAWGVRHAGAQSEDAGAGELKIHIARADTWVTCAAMAAVQAATTSGAETSMNRGEISGGSASGVMA